MAVFNLNQCKMIKELLFFYISRAYYYLCK